MHGLCINGCDHYLYPEETPELDTFMERLEESEVQFFPLQALRTERCVVPFFIAEDVKTVYVNLNTVTTLEDEEITLLSLEDYETRLREMVCQRCTDCAFYEEDETNPLEGHRENLCLDGTCWRYEAKAD